MTRRRQRVLFGLSFSLMYFSEVYLMSSKESYLNAIHMAERIQEDPSIVSKESSPSEGLGGLRKVRNEVVYDDTVLNQVLKDASTMNLLKEEMNTFKEETSSNDSSVLVIPESLYGKKGTEKGKVAANSYYNKPVPKGFTRNAGGAPKESQEAAIKEIIRVGRTLEATPEQIAYALATARYESGFNIYASAKSTSPGGLGQFINETGGAYGLNSENREDLGMQAQALIEHTMDNFDMAAKKGYDKSYVYALHHDGPKLNKGGLAISKKHIMPLVSQYQKLLETYR